LNETSFATVTNDNLPEEDGWICPVTFQRVFAPIPCSFGSRIVFSSTEAREVANKTFHQYEWSLIEDFKNQGISLVARLAFRIVLGIPVNEIKSLAEEVRNFENRTVKQDQLSTVAKVLTLETASDLSLEDSTCLYLLTNYFMECLKVCGYLPKESSSIFQDVAFLMTRAIQVVAEHSVPITEGKFVENKSDLWTMKNYPSEVVGFGIFPKLSLLKTVSKKEAEKSGAGSDCIMFFQVPSQ